MQENKLRKTEKKESVLLAMRRLLFFGWSEIISLMSFCVFFHLVFEKNIKKIYFEKLWPLKLFKRQNDTFLPEKNIKN